MGRQRRNYRRVVRTFPCDFPTRLARLKEASGLSWRALARQLGTDPSTLRCWRNGQPPSGVYLYALFSIAGNVPCGRAILIGRPENREAVEANDVVGNNSEGERVNQSRPSKLIC